MSIFNFLRKLFKKRKETKKVKRRLRRKPRKKYLAKVKAKREKKELLVSDVMTRRIISLKPNQSLFEAVKTFLDHQISGAPILEKNKLVGIIYKNDIFKLLEISGFEEINEEKERKLKSEKVKEFMKKPSWVYEHTPLKKAIELMDKKRIDRLLVFSRKKELIGIITRTDLMKGISKQKIGEKVETLVDTMLKIVEKEGSITLRKLSYRLRVSESILEEWARILEENGLIKIEYSALGKPILKFEKRKSY